MKNELMEENKPSNKGPTRNNKTSRHDQKKLEAA